MREFAAIPIVAVILGFGVALLMAGEAGPWAWVALGGAAVVLSALVVWLVGRSHRHPSREAAPRVAPAADPTRHRVLLVADESCTSEAFVAAVGDHAAGRALDVFVIAPSLGSRLARWTGDDHPYADAERHLTDTLAALRRAGIACQGHVGDHDPLQAADDALREFPADEVLFAVHGDGEENWLEQGVVGLAAGRYSVPVEHVVVRPS